MPKLINEAWARIGALHTVLKWISEGISLDFDEEPQQCHLPNRIYGRNQENFVNQEVSKLLDRNSIKQV